MNKINDIRKEIQYFHTDFKSLKKSEAKAPADNTDGVFIRGYASTPTLDRYNDIVEPEAFRKSIATAYRKNPIILFQHINERPIGKAYFLSIDGNGLYIEAQIIDDEIAPKIKADILRTFSIGYIPVVVEYRNANGDLISPETQGWSEVFAEGSKRIIKEVDLVEISVVSVPANSDAIFTVEKSVKSYFNNLKKDMENTKENLLDKEDKRKKKDDTAEPAVEPAKEPEAEPEVTPEKPAEEKPAEEVKPDEKEKAEPVAVPDDTITPDAETDVPAEAVETNDICKDEPAKEAEKTVAVEVKDAKDIKDVLEIATKTIAQLAKENEVLKKELATLPAKQAQVFVEHTKMPLDKNDGKTPAKKPEEKQGFKSALLKSAN